MAKKEKRGTAAEQPRQALSTSEKALVKLFAERAKTAVPPLYIFIHDTDYRADPAWWTPEVRARLVARGVHQFFLDRMPIGERPRVHSVARILRGTAEIQYDEHHECYLWLLSFLLYGRYIEVCDAAGIPTGDEIILASLPPLVQTKGGFFLGQWWIRGLIEIWAAAEEFDKIDRLVLRAPGKGKGNYRQQQIRWLQRWTIVSAVNQLRRDGLSYTAALKAVEQRVHAKAFGDGPIISYEGIRGIYDAIRKSLRSRVPPAKVRGRKS